MPAMRLLLLPLLLAASLHASDFYIGTFTKEAGSKGIYHARLDPARGTIGKPQLASEVPSPNFLALSPDGKFLYAAMRGAGPEVGGFRVEPGGRLTPLGTLPAGGEGPCHVSLDRAGKFLFVANYSGGSVASFSIRPDGSLGKMVSFLQFTGSGPDKARQQSPHAHGIYPAPDNRFVYACDLGTDDIRILALDGKSGTLTEAGVGRVPAGAGPRHLAFSPDGRFAYVANEMGLTVTAFRRDAATGALEAIGTVRAHASRPDGASLAEIEMHPSGKWLYVSSRGDDTIAVFTTGANGRIIRVENAPAGVKIPRGFAIDPSGKWLVVVGQEDGALATLAIDSASGRLGPASATTLGGAPVCIVFEQ
jgi:6-phosphogluconolactonase